VRRRPRRNYLHDLTEALHRHPELRERTVYRAELPMVGPAKPDDPILARLRQEEAD
jgi:hypothetical protein